MISTLLPQPRTRLKRIKAFQNAYLIFNPVAGGANVDRELKTIESLLKPHLNLTVWLTTPERDAADLAKQAVAEGADLIIAAGGDGTVSAAASAVIHTEVTLAVIPRGTANAFVNGLGLPNTLEEACIAILQGATRTIGTVKCNDQLMLLLAGIGFEAETVQAADRDLKNQFGMLAYILAGLKQLQRPQQFEARLETEQQTITVPAIALTVASIAPPTSILAQGSGELRPDDELFDITIVSPTSALEVLTSAIDLFTNGLVQSPSENEHIGYLRASKVTVTTNPPQQIALDGEVFGTTPATFEMMPQSLTVVMDYRKFMAEQQKLVDLPGVEIVSKQEHPDLVLHHFIPVNLLDVLGEQLLEVSQATVTLWHKVTTAIAHTSHALIEFIAQTFYRLLWGVDRVLEAMFNSVEKLLTGQSTNRSSPSTTYGIRIAHKTSGRIRVKVSRLSKNPAVCDRIHLNLHQLVGVQSVTINPVADSIVIYFDPKLPLADIEQDILTAIADSSDLTIVEPITKEPQASNPVAQIIDQASQQIKHLSDQAMNQINQVLEKPVPLAADSAAGVAGAAAGFAIGEVVGGSIGAFFGPGGVIAGAEAGAWLGQVVGGQGTRQISHQLLKPDESEPGEEPA
ncbi:diacylglycerol kinase, catalytic region [Leptolyngbya sp. NIES-3755]|nr:diacylglycerol kinase, catalytic region [Leptolyngbya sp. NIES-3755]